MANVNDSKRVYVHVTRSFDAPAEKVFDAWLNTGILSNWMFGPSVRDEEIISLTNDPRPQGRFSFVVKRGSDIINHVGTYLELQRPARLVFTWGIDDDPGAESVVKVDIQPTKEGCRLQLEHDMDIAWSEYAERTKEAWTLMLGLLKEHLD